MENCDKCPIMSIPPELLANIFCFLNESDIKNVSQTCTAFCGAAKIEVIWQNKCFSVLGKQKIDLDDFDSYFTLYTKMLYPYGYLLGMWKPDCGCYGGLIDVVFEASRLICRQYSAPLNPHVTEPLKMKTAFEIKLKDDKSNVEIICHGGFYKSHSCIVSKGDIHGDEFCMKCCQPNNHKHPKGKEKELEEWMWTQIDKEEQQHGFEAFYAMNLLNKKFEKLSSSSLNMHCTRLHVDFSKHGAVIQPGLFKGTYGTHGIEILKLEYDDENNTAVLTKITGDPNVPCNKVSMIADLSRPMILTAEQQESIRMLQQIDIADVPPDIPHSELPPQPFREPMDCFDRSGMERSATKHTCKARFHAKGQIAGDGFFEPSFTPSHWVIFDEDTFANVWLTLFSLSTYSRIKQF